ncbi:protein of unknown function [Modestobacter italicus]|uniref:GmrSD restriction endonucleases N-terminal domain-containing protein n=1 Tax=Modestobacter italicus (strain DSM 44449 / CECT 9708 / BC 501) TaxID=2732864 RepID=I4EQH1_MODI5|nr:protein of unknown function [Modestobacter marinus]
MLPDFQRDFKWTDKDVVALLATVLSGWPIGSLMLVEGPPSFFQVRSFEAAPAAEDARSVVFTVLDGQQRLTALYHSLYGKGDFRYALHLDKLGEATVDDLEDALQAHSIADWVRSFMRPVEQGEQRIVPMTALRSPADFFAWRDSVVATLPSSHRTEWVGSIDRLYRRLLSGVDRYTIPSIIVGSSIAAEAIARIFERVNQTGWKLSTFDLMVAKSFTTDFNLRRVWDASQVQYPRLAAFLEGDGLPVLHTIALREAKDLRQSAVLRLSGGDIRDRWSQACHAMDAAIAFLANRCGVARPEWLPYQNLMTVLGALAQDVDLDSIADELTSWFWFVAASGAYDVGSNTTAVRDYVQLRGDQPQEPRRDVTILVADAITSTPRRKQSFYKTFRCALVANGARDLITDQLIVSDRLGEGVLSRVWALSMFLRDHPGVSDGPRPSARTLSTVLSLSSPSFFARQVPQESGIVSLRHAHDGAGQMLETRTFNADDSNVDQLMRGRLREYVDFLERQGLRVVTLEEQE